MSKILIEARPRETWGLLKGESLRVSEFYMDTIQGEGVYTGCPATFLRLQGCFLNCVYCDTTKVWRTGNPYRFNELFNMMDEADLISKFQEGQHLVITGGSPLLQQDSLIAFLGAFKIRYYFLPFIEVENECCVAPNFQLVEYVDCWNNSPKLTNSGVSITQRFNKKAIESVAKLKDSWFKFVITCEEDWFEIKLDFINPKLIQKDQIILMPEGCTAEELSNKWEMVVDMAIRNDVRYCNREHIMIWGRKTGV